MRTIRECEVCVVGGAGFLGSHLVNHLIDDRGCKVLVVDNLCAGRREFVHKDATFVHHDITGSEEHLCGIFQQHSIKYVWNYAAHPYVPDSFERPVHVCNVNFIGAMKVINAAHKACVRGILQVSSAEVYGEVPIGAIGWTNNRVSERAPLYPHSSYGVSKAAVDAAVQVRWKEAKTPCIALRQFNCIGERETHSYIVPEIISQLTHNPVLTDRYGSKVVKLGNNSFRDFLYAGDAVKIAVLLLERGEFGEVYNLGSESGIKIYDLAKKIGKLMGFERVEVEHDKKRDRPYEIWHLQSDNTKILDASAGFPLREQPASFDDALKKTIVYYEASGRKWVWE